AGARWITAKEMIEMNRSVHAFFHTVRRRKGSMALGLGAQLGLRVGRNGGRTGLGVLIHSFMWNPMLPSLFGVKGRYSGVPSGRRTIRTIFASSSDRTRRT